MPLIKGDTPNVVAQNIKTEVAAGKPQKHAVAIALHTAHDAEYAPVTALSVADINARNKKYWQQTPSEDCSADAAPLKVSVKRPIGYEVHTIGPGGKTTLVDKGGPPLEAKP